MQHPEEGTIHSWLDGQLPLTEAAEIESHVAACPTCGAVVAEARGFIAGSSRILTGLDNAPRGVLPAAAPKSGNRRAMLRAAAAVFVVAAGSFVVLGRTGSDATQFDSQVGKEAAPTVVNQSAAAPTAMNDSTTIETGVAAITAPPAPRGEIARTGRERKANPIVRGGTSAGRPTASDAATAPTIAATTTTSKSADIAAQRPDNFRGGVSGVKTASPAAAEKSIYAQLPAPAMADVAPMSPELRLARTDSSAGVRRTVFEVGGGQTVTLMESPVESMQLSQVVTTGVATGEAAGQSAPRIRARTGAREAPAQAVPQTAPQGTAAGVALAPSPSTAAMGINTISWVDLGTGRRSTLSGPFTVGELRAIRVRLDALKKQEPKKAP